MAQETNRAYKVQNIEKDLDLAYPTFPGLWFIQVEKDRPRSPTRGTRAADTTMEELRNSRALVELPGLPCVVETPDPRLPSVAIGTGAGDVEECGHVLLHTSLMQFGAKDSVEFRVNLQ